MIKLMTFEEFYTDHPQLAHDHWASFPNHGEGGELVLDPDRFVNCDVFVLYAGEVAVGYALFTATESPYTVTTVVQNVALFFIPEARGRGFGREFLSQIERYYKEVIGDYKIELQFKPHNIPEGLLDSLGFVISEVRYSKSVVDTEE